jgi:hypothetical protein
MRFMIAVKATWGAGGRQNAGGEALGPMTAYHEELARAGVLLDASGLQPISKSWRIKYSGRVLTVVDGPFTEGKSRDEARDWTKRFPNPMVP